MVDTGRARLFRRKDGKFLIYLPKDFCEDSQFPFNLKDENASIHLTVTFDTKHKKLLLELPTETQA